MEQNDLLRLIGLCKKAGRLEVGEEPVGSACRARDCRLLLIAADAADNTVRRAAHFAQAGNCLTLRLPFSRDDLGRAVGRTSCALAAITDIGFASALAGRLAKADPETYGETAQQLEVKAKRAQERRKEQLRHEKKLRRMGRSIPSTDKDAKAVPEQRMEKKPSAHRPQTGKASSDGGPRSSRRPFSKSKPFRHPAKPGPGPRQSGKRSVSSGHSRPPRTGERKKQP